MNWNFQFFLQSLLSILDILGYTSIANPEFSNLIGTNGVYVSTFRFQFDGEFGKEEALEGFILSTSTRPLD